MRSYDRAEMRISSVLWPAIASVSGVLVYWLWHSEEDNIGAVLFLALTFMGTVCTFIVWWQLLRGSRDMGGDTGHR